MAKARPSRLRLLMFWFTPITRSPAQKPACKDLSRNAQARAITSEAAYTPVSNRVGSRSPKKAAFRPPFCSFPIHYLFKLGQVVRRLRRTED